MQPYDDVAAEVRERQQLALAWAHRRRLAGAARSARPRVARIRLAVALRHLAAWVEGGEAPASVTLRPS